jgi:replicative DNA helicase
MTERLRLLGGGSGNGGNLPPPTVTGRVVPHNLEAEAAVLSAILLDREALDLVLELLAKEHFYSTANELVFEACSALASSGSPIDVVSVAAWLRDREQIQKIGGVRYLAQLVDATPAVAHVEAHAKVVKEKWRLRELIRTCQKYAAEGYGDVGETQQFIDDAEQAIYDIARTETRTSTVLLADALKDTFEAINAAAKRGDHVSGVPTGYTDLDKRLAGLHDGDLLIVAARPGMGKSSLVLNIATNIASPELAPEKDGERRIERPGDGVALFSLEMPNEQLSLRMVCSEARIDISKARGGWLSIEDWGRLTSAAGQLAQLPIWIDDTPALGLLDLRSKVRRLQAEAAKRKCIGCNGGGRDSDGDCYLCGGAGVYPLRLGMVGVDYLQLMSASGKKQNREQDVSELSRGLKAVAKELSVPVVALSQLNRGVEIRKDKRPMLVDLRESGAIEQDADTIVFIFRPEYYEKGDQPGIAELIVAKQRNGPTGTTRTRFTGSYTRFDNLAPGEYLDEDDHEDF